MSYPYDLQALDAGADIWTEYYQAQADDLVKVGLLFGKFEAVADQHGVAEETIPEFAAESYLRYASKKLQPTADQIEQRLSDAEVFDGGE